MKVHGDFLGPPLSLCFAFQCFVSFLVLETPCLVVLLLLSSKFHVAVVALPRGIMRFSVLCDCAISLP